ncbi:MAG: S24 family peptidase [Parolsenella sp.]|uniref:S24 family peptidase n=1 Tax=Parolsenella sp. TaxID=2083006 RepID=UPI002E766112|nr:S24 family peptidase [Parolsenella sp.]MEE1372991.1 S24 family peptidase [Parolsenella sp.]
MGIPENIDALLVKFDLKPESLARIAGVSTATVSRWRTGQTDNIRKANLDRICEELELSPDDILSSSAGLAAKEHGRYAMPDGAMPVRGTSAMVPLRVLGATHAGERMDEDESDYMVEFPRSVAERHPGCFALRVEGDCMNRRYPEGCHIMVDPNMEPRNGSAVVAEFEDGRSVLRNYLRGSSTLMLTADSFAEHEDIIVTLDDPPVRTVGVVVWYQADKETE